MCGLETRARGGSGAGMRPKQLFCMAAAEEAAAVEGAGPRVGGLTGLEGGMLLECAGVGGDGGGRAGDVRVAHGAFEPEPITLEPEPIFAWHQPSPWSGAH